MKKALSLLLAVSCYSNSEAVPEGCDIEQQKDHIAETLGAIEFCGMQNDSALAQKIQTMSQADQKLCGVTRDQQLPSPDQISQKVQALRQEMPSDFSPAAILKGIFGLDSAKPTKNKWAVCNSFRREVMGIEMTTPVTPTPIVQERLSQEDQQKASYQAYLGFVPRERHNYCLFFVGQNIAIQQEFQSAFYGKKSLNEALYYATQRVEMSSPPPYEYYHTRLNAMKRIQQTIFSGKATDADLIKYRVSAHSQCITAIQKMADDIDRERSSIQNKPYNYSQR